ncbi:MAG TPA: UvrB/UvrC motif-containing protein [Gemmatimonadales bacterium]|nr:UvrB/UvrC motif-containing protein [Gemmatimonadales bacterium]
MDCDQCRERPAEIHLTQIVDDQVRTLHLCARCAAERGVESVAQVTSTPLGGFLASMGKGLAAGLPTTEPGGCPQCGASLRDFREVGRLGCPACYRTFEAPLRELLRRLHGSSRHLGEQYVATGASASETRRLQAELREQLRLAIETQNFELAAELRDRLKVYE